MDTEGCGMEIGNGSSPWTMAAGGASRRNNLALRLFLSKYDWPADSMANI